MKRLLLAFVVVLPAAIALAEPEASNLSPLDARGLVAEALLLESAAGDYRAACDKYRELLDRSEAWAPLRSVASWYLWRATELADDAFPQHLASA